MLITHTELPPGFLSADARDLRALLGGPTLFHFEGHREPRLFVSVLLHGNETSGFEAIKRLLRHYEPGGGDRPLPRSLSIFVGNVRAAEKGVRRFDDQPDYNRIWPGSPTSGTPEHALMAQVTHIMRQRQVFGSIDLHNSNGRNPHYACVNKLDQRFLQMATLFNRTVVYYLRPRGVQSMAFADFTTAVTLECGQAGIEQSVDHAYEYLEACLNLSEIPDRPVAPHDLDLFHTVAIISIPPDVRFGFNSKTCDLVLRDDIEKLNFRELPAGTPFARTRAGSNARFQIRDETGADVTARYFTNESDEIRLKQPIMPCLLTRNVDIIRQDNLCYLMERYSLDYDSN